MHSAKAALCSGTVVSLSKDEAQAAEVVAKLVLEVAAGDLLCLSRYDLVLYHCLNPDVRARLRSPCQYTKSAGRHPLCPVHCWGKLYQSSVREMNMEQLHQADACFCGAAVVPSRTKYLNAELAVLAAMKFNVDGVLGTWYGSIVYYDLSSRQPSSR